MDQRYVVSPVAQAKAKTEGEKLRALQLQATWKKRKTSYNGEQIVEKK